MTYTTLLPLAWFLLVASITPGPNNTMLAASGMNFGLRRTTGHIAGIVIGFASLVFLCALGLGTLYEQVPEVRIALKTAGAAYLLYLAWRIARAGEVQSGSAARPLTLWQAAAFQYVNPKAWVMGLTATSSFLPDSAPLTGALTMLAVAMIVAAPSTLIWTLFGTGLARLWSGRRVRRAINLTLALLLVATVPFIIL